MEKTLFVPDMSCQHCVGRIKKALDAAGIQGYEIVLDSKELRVKEPDAEKSVAVLTAAGYPPASR